MNSNCSVRSNRHGAIATVLRSRVTRSDQGKILSAARQPLFSAGLRLAYHSSLPSKTVSAKVCSRPAALLRWLFEAKKRFGLSVLNYMVTSNHIHLLIRRHWSKRYRREHAAHRGSHSAGIQPAQRSAGAFWEDRYHATAVQADQHLHRCMVYIDLNIVRAGVALAS